MKRIQLSAAGWDTPAAAHAALSDALGFPGYYGRNLDALADCLGEVSDTQLVLEDCARAAAQMPEAWPGFLAVFLDAAQNNPGLEIRLLPGQGDYDGERESGPCPVKF